MTRKHGVLLVMGILLALGIRLLTLSDPAPALTPPAPPLTLLGERTPAAGMVDDPAAVELGTRFAVAQDGVITGLRFYKGGAAAGESHLGTLWDDQGRIVAEVSTNQESQSGWQVARHATPILLRGDGEQPYFERQQIEHEIVTLFVPLSGCEHIWPQLRTFLE